MSKPLNGRFRKKKTYFTQVSNTTLRDKTLSLKAKGLYALIESYITLEGFTLYKNHLKNQCKEGETAFESAWKELKDSGYLMQYKLQSDRGRFYYEYELFDQVESEKAATPLKTRNRPDPQNQGSGQPTSGKGGVYKNTDLKNTNSNNTSKDIFLDNEKSVSQSSKEQKTDRTTEYNKSLRTKIKEQVHYEMLIQSEDSSMVDELINNLEDMYYADSIKVNGRNIVQARVRACLENLRDYHLEHVIKQYNDTSSSRTSIRNTKSYLQSCLYNSLLEANSKIHNDIRVKGLV